MIRPKGHIFDHSIYFFLSLTSEMKPRRVYRGVTDNMFVGAGSLYTKDGWFSVADLVYF